MPAAVRRRMSAYRLYLGLEFTGSMLVSLAYTTSIVYMVDAGHLNPLQLVLLGTIIELTYFIFQLPTGVLADAYSKRFCVVVGWILTGAGFAMQGLSPTFRIFALAQIVVGIGAALQDGAQAAWVADETDRDPTPIYVRAAQLGIVGGIVGSVASGFISGIALHLPMLVGGLALCLCGVGLAFIMPETKRAPKERLDARPRSLGRRVWADFVEQIGTTRIAVIAVPGLVLLLGMTFFLGGWSESFDRLWSAYLLEDIRFPQVAGVRPAMWLSGLAVIVALLSLGASEVAKRRTDRLGQTSVVTTLLGSTALIALGTLAMASAHGFVVAAAAYLLVQAVRPVIYPLMTGWIVGRVPSGVRATALSARDMFDSGGQMLGGPIVGWIGLSRSIRAALYAGAAAFGPALVLLVAATRRVRALPPGDSTPEGQLPTEEAGLPLGIGADVGAAGDR